MRERLSRTVDRARIGRTPFCIVSDDCWGAEVYRWLGRPYNTPFVGMYVPPDGFLELLGDLERYLAMPLESRGEHGDFQGSRYPVARLGDVEVQLLHYASPEQAIETWRRRVARVDLDHLAVKLDASKPGVRAEHVAAFEAVQWPRRLVLGRPGTQGAVEVPDWTIDGAAMFERSRRVLDVVGWLK